MLHIRKEQTDKFGPQAAKTFEPAPTPTFRMLHIRKEQYRELGKISLKRFEDEMVAHIKKFFPKYYKVYGEALVRKVIQYGVERAEKHGFETKRDTPLFIDLMLLLGSHFDEDIQYPWVAKVLDDKFITKPIARADELYDTAIRFLDETAGKKNEYFVGALLRIREISLEDVSNKPSPDVTSRLAGLLRDIWPQKVNKLGRYITDQLIELAIQFAQKYNITSEQGLTVISVLMFMLGSGFDSDPQFPWVARVLNDETSTSPIEKTNQLYKEATAFMGKWLV